MARGGPAGSVKSCCLAHSKVEQREEDRRGLRDASECEREALGRPVMEICPMTRLALSTSTARQLGYKVDVGRGERIGRVAPEW
jgi:predicted RNase H-like nuclease